MEKVGKKKWKNPGNKKLPLSTLFLSPVRTLSLGFPLVLSAQVHSKLDNLRRNSYFLPHVYVWKRVQLIFSERAKKKL